jgi:hypothetical protein
MQKFLFLRNFLFFETIFEELKPKPDLENKINSNVDHRQSPVFLFYFKVPSRGLICIVLSRFILYSKKKGIITE